MNDPDGVHRQIAEYEATIKSHEDEAARQVEDIWSSTQPGIDAACEIIRRQEALIAQTEAAREAQKRDIFSHTSEVTAHTRSLLGDAKHQLAAVSAPILGLPTECIVEVMQYFNEVNRTVVLLLVSKRWNAIATATPRLWSKIAITTYGLNSHQFLRLRGAHICGSLERLSSVLSLAKDGPLDIELCVRSQSGTQQIQHIPMLDGRSTTDASDYDKHWPCEALKLVGADGRSQRWQSLYITDWYGMEGEAPFKAIKGPFRNLRLLYIWSFGSRRTWPYTPLVAAIVQGAPRLSTVYTRDLYILQGIDGWKHQRFWKNIECYHSLAAPCDDLSILSQAPRLTDLSLSSWRSIPQSEPVSLPCLRTLRLLRSPLQLLDKFRFPILETLFLDDVMPIGVVNIGTIPVPSVRSIIFTNCSDVRILQRFSAPTLYHLDISCLGYAGSRAETKALQMSFSETFDGSQFMPKPISLHLDLPVTESQLLSALYLLPQIEELRIRQRRPHGSKFWNALVPRGAGGRRKAKQYCPKLRIMVFEARLCSYGNSTELSKAQILELGVKMATAREQEGQTLSHLLFIWFDESKDEVLGSFNTLPLHPCPGPIT